MDLHQIFYFLASFLKANESQDSNSQYDTSI